MDFSRTKKIVIKVGTSALTHSDGTIDPRIVQSIAQQIEKARKEGKEIVLVSSGAVGAGMGELKIAQKPRDPRLRQVCAAVGQTNLMTLWKTAFRHSTIAQLLITYDTFTERSRYVSLQGTLTELLKRGIIPIMNENDPISQVGADFGDNDRLSALLSTKIQADVLIILSTVDGLLDEKKKVIPLVREVSTDTFRFVQKSTGLGKGGMEKKLEAIKIATEGGIPVVLSNGKTDGVISRILSHHDIGTSFLAKSRKPSLKTWIEQTIHAGVLEIDDGAAQALRSGKNLLPVGVKKVEGLFSVGDVVAIVCRHETVAKFRTSFPSERIVEMVKKKEKENITKKENVVVL